MGSTRPLSPIEYVCLFAYQSINQSINYVITPVSILFSIVIVYSVIDIDIGIVIVIVIDMDRNIGGGRG